MSLQADPNPAHYALAELARKMPGFLTLSQNVDGLSQRADHPRKQLQLLHGTLFEVKCSDPRCGYSEPNFTDPIVPALEIPTDGKDPTSNEVRKEINDQLQTKKTGQDLDISDINVPLPDLTIKDLPMCPQCKKSLLRPAVVWFGESLPFAVLETVDHYVRQSEKIDLVCVMIEWNCTSAPNFHANRSSQRLWLLAHLQRFFRPRDTSKRPDIKVPEYAL